ncbi:MAG: hypothetical protein QM796_19695 [Chthoniobacteraceae bacterium]
MGGIPWLRLLLTTCCLLLALPAVLHLTSHADPAQATAAVAPSASPVGDQVQVQLTFAHAPASFTVMHLGKVVWEGGQPGTATQKNLTMPFPPEGVDLELKATWPAGTPETAVRVTLTPKDQSPIVQNAWGSGSLDAVLTFQPAVQ